MSAPNEAVPLTPADLLALPDRDRYELVDGELVELNVSRLSSLVALVLGSLLHDFCKPGGLAWIFGPDCGYRCFPGHPNRIRKPDVSVVLRQRMTVEQLAEEGWAEIAPDLAVEVVSPSDTYYDVDEKIADYLSAGVPLVWVVNPELRTVMVYRADGSVSRLLEADELTGEAVLPGFSCRIAELFPAA